jgi:Gas vesicle synthesis protein GvpL/GvpF
MRDELARWAASRAPDLLARAEAEAVAELRRALVDAALGRRDEPGVVEPAPQAAPAPRGEVLWAFGIAGREAEIPEITSAVSDPRRVEHLVQDDLVLLAARVPRAEFAEEPLRRNLNDLAWLERVARAHEAVLAEALQHATVVPLRLSTIFESEPSATHMLEQHADRLRAVLAALDGRQEWSVKLLVHLDKLIEAIADDESSGTSDAPSAGAAYMLRRRAEREQRELAVRLGASMADDVHARLADWAIDAVLRPAQNRELSGHEGEMLLNGAYLVETAKVPQLRELVEELRDRHAGVGARIQLTGPFPPYNFVPQLDA